MLYLQVGEPRSCLLDINRIKRAGVVFRRNAADWA